MDGSNTLRARLMLGVSNLIYKYHWPILAAAVVITVFSYFSLQHLELKLNFTDMLSDEDPAVIQYKHAVEQFGALSFLFVVVESDDLEQSKRYADALAKKLVEDPDFVPRVFHKVELRDFLDDALLFMEPRELEMIADLVERSRDQLAGMAKDPGLPGMIEGVDSMLKSYVSKGEVPDLGEEDVDFGLVFDPLRDLVSSFEDYALNGPSGQKEKLKKEFLSRLMGAQELPMDPSEPYLVASDNRHLLMLVSSTRPAEDFEWCRTFIDYVEGRIDSLRQEFPDVPRPKMTGNAAIMRDDNDVVRKDMKLTTTVAFVCIMILFAFSFRNLSSILMVAVPLATGIVWALGAAYWLIGYLTFITAIFGAILLGLGIDYAILILSRYTEERHQGRSIKESLDITMTQTGVSIITGAAATSLAFFSLTSGTFAASKEMGIISGTGIILFVAIMTFGLGSLLVAWDRAKENVGPTQRRWDPKIMKQIARITDKGALWIALLLTAVVGFMAYMVPRYQFEYNYLNLEPQNVESIQLVHKIPDWFGIDTNYGMIISRSVEKDRELAADLRSRKTVSRVDAISDFIPPGQDEKLPIIARIRDAIAGIGPVKAPPEGEAAPMSEEQFERTLSALRSLRDTVGAPGRGLIGLFYLAELEEAEMGARDLLASLDELISSLEGARGPELLANLGDIDRDAARGVSSGFDWLHKMAGTQGVSIDTIREKHPELIDRFQGRDGSFLIYAYPSLVIWEEQNLKAVSRELKEVDPDAMGVAVLFDRILDQLKADLFRVALIALGVVFVVLLINYRGLYHTLLTLIPLVAGALTMVGVMNLMGLKFNIVNTGMLPLVIGIGVDYGVYVVHRWIGEGKGLKSIRPVVESTGRAVTLSALTTMIGFASIILAQWRGLSLMGGTLTMGIGFCWIAAVIYLAAILKIIELFKARRRRE